jgi:hybrid cluster-associated redox disulfide protein
MHTPTLETTIAELLAGWPAARAVVGRRGMACLGCAMARFETIGEAAAAYGFDPAAFIQEVTHARTDVRSGSRTRGRDAARRRAGRSRSPHRHDRRGR